MKRQNLDYAGIAERIGEKRTDKLSVAVRCTNGVGRRAIEIRIKIAAALGLDPEQVWDKIYLQQRPRGHAGYSKVQPANTISENDWRKMAPSARVRALLVENELNIQQLSEMYGVTYRVMTNNIYGNTASHDLRLKIAKQFNRAPEDIWDNIYGSEDPRKNGPISKALAKQPQLAAFLGFGDLTKNLVFIQQPSSKIDL